MSFRVLFAAPLLLAAVCLVALAIRTDARVDKGVTTRVSVSSEGAEGDDTSSFPAVSAGGEWVAFESTAGNLDPGDTNSEVDIFVRDLPSGTTRLVSLNNDNESANGAAVSAAISADGRFVAFASSAGNLVPGDSNNVFDVFVRDLQADATERISVNSDGEETDAYSGSPAISGDGRFVAFLSAASNLVPGDTNDVFDVFLRDRQQEITERVSVSSDGGQGDDNADVPALSADGRYVAFMSFASNLVPGDTNGQPDIFVRDRLLGITTRVSVASGGAQASGSSYEAAISTDGRFVVFVSSATDLVPGDTNGCLDVFLHDRENGQTERVSVAAGGVQADGDSFEPDVSADGRFVVFASLATNLVRGDNNEESDVFVRDRQTGQSGRLSVDSSGVEADGGSYAPATTADGLGVVFASWAMNLVPEDENAAQDIFLRQWRPGATVGDLFLPVVLGG